MSDGGDYGHTRDSAGKDGPARLTTRTRLPGSEGGGRPPSRPGRSLITVVGVIVLLIAAIAFANQGGDGGDPRTDEGRNGGAQPQPTAPSGEKPVDATDSPATGFPRTQQGAQSAAANYAVALVSADIIKPEKRGELIQRIFVPDKVSEMRTKMDKAYSPKFLKNLGLDENGEAENGMTYVSRTSPVGTKSRDFSKSSAKLDVWCTGVFGTAGGKSTNPVTSDWFTLRLDLRWEDGDWKVQSFAQKAGPAPVNGDNRASGADEIADAVDEFGGFTYAR